MIPGNRKVEVVSGENGKEEEDEEGDEEETIQDSEPTSEMD